MYSLVNLQMRRLRRGFNWLGYGEINFLCPSNILENGRLVCQKQVFRGCALLCDQCSIYLQVHAANIYVPRIGVKLYISSFRVLDHPKICRKGQIGEKNTISNLHSLIWIPCMCLNTPSRQNLPFYIDDTVITHDFGLILELLAEC